MASLKILNPRAFGQDKLFVPATFIGGAICPTGLRDGSKLRLSSGGEDFFQKKDRTISHYHIIYGIEPTTSRYTLF